MLYKETNYFICSSRHDPDAIPTMLTVGRNAAIPLWGIWNSIQLPCAVPFPVSPKFLPKIPVSITTSPTMYKGFFIRPVSANMAS